MFADLDHVGEHALDTINPGDHVGRSGGWVSEDRFVSIYWLMVTTSPSMTRQAVGAVDFADIEPKQMSTGLPRKSAVLSGKMTPLVEAIELHEEP
jgi:hypothetical protein